MLAIFLLISRLNIFKIPKALFIVLFFVFLISKPNVLLNYTKCPDCFDDKLCEPLENGHIRLSWISKLFLILHPKLTKSVFFASTDQLERVVLKSTTGRSEMSITSRKYESSIDILKHVITDNTFKSDDHIQNVILCPNVKSFYLLFESIDENLLNLLNTKRLWLDIQISIEPLLLKFLASASNISVPRLYGACGDIIFTEYKGKSLSNYYSSDWKQRVFLSVQLLKVVEALTFFHLSLIFYLMDISPDNIVVDSSGMISLVDLDHVIITERTNESGDLKSLSNVHVSKVVDPARLTISPSDICKYSVSDHNYYAVCKYILIGSKDSNVGLLDEIPTDILQKHENFSTLLKECGEPNLFDNRIYAGRLLQVLLEEIIPNFEWKQNS